MGCRKYCFSLISRNSPIPFPPCIIEQSPSMYYNKHLCAVSGLFVFVFLDRIWCISGWPQTHCVANSGFKLFLLLPLPPRCWDHNYVLLHAVSAVLGINPMVLNSWQLNSASASWVLKLQTWSTTFNSIAFFLLYFELEVSYRPGWFETPYVN